MSNENAKCNGQPAGERSCPDPAGSALVAAKEISDYLLTGWHHNTNEARLQMAKIIERHFKQNTEDDGRESKGD